MADHIKTFPLDEYGFPGKYITVPRRLGGRRMRAINSASNPNEFSGFDGQGNPQFRPAFDPNAGAWEALRQAATHQDANWNLTDEKGKPLSRDMVTIDENTQYQDAFLRVSVPIYVYVYSQADTSAEGNGDGSAPATGDSGSSKASTPAVKGKK